VEILSGLVTLANALLAGVIGVRLVRLAARTQKPERWLGLYFLAAPGFAVRVLNGPAYWIGFAVRIAALVWMAVEAFRYRGLLRRRVALGLAEPLVANRFLLWGLWALCAVAMGLSDPVARVWHRALTGTASVWHPEIGRPIVVVVMAMTSAVGVVGATCVFLTFFPTAGYRRWVARGAAAPGAA
jgi:hypothetical protein